VAHLNVGEGDGGRARGHHREVEALHHEPHHRIRTKVSRPCDTAKVDLNVEGREDALESLQVSMCRAVIEIHARV
jgi:hypothetical protein